MKDELGVGKNSCNKYIIKEFCRFYRDFPCVDKAKIQIKDTTTGLIYSCSLSRKELEKVIGYSFDLLKKDSAKWQEMIDKTAYNKDFANSFAVKYIK